MNPAMAATAVVEPVESTDSPSDSAQQMAEKEGLSFAGTPGAGYSEGGDVYEPKAATRLLFGISQRGGAAADHQPAPAFHAAGRLAQP
jgi:hypothetical protein